MRCIYCSKEMELIQSTQFMTSKFSHLGIESKSKEIPAQFKCKCGGECDLNGETFNHPTHPTLNKKRV